MAGQYILGGDPLDGGKLVLGSDVPHRNKLDAVGLAVRDIHEHGAKVPHPLAVGNLVLHLLFGVIVHVRVSGVEDEPHVGAVEEVFAPKQGGVLVEQGRLQATQVIGHAIDLLLGVVLRQPDHILRPVEQVRLALLLQVNKAAIVPPAAMSVVMELAGQLSPTIEQNEGPLRPLLIFAQTSLC